MINVERGVRVLAAERLSDLGGGDLRLCRLFVILLLEAVIFLVTNKFVVALEDQIALFARVVDATRLLLVGGVVGRGAAAKGNLNATLSLMEFQGES